MTTLTLRRRTIEHGLLLLAGVGGLVLLVFGVPLVLPPGVDWETSFYPATRQLWQGSNPYQGDLEFYNPPWTALVLGPLAVFPVEFGRAVLFVVAFLSYAYMAYRFGGSPLAVGIFLCSPPVLHGLLNATLDWLVLIGVLLPPPVGLFVVLIKPQVGIGVAIFWLLRGWLDDGWQETGYMAGPLVLAGLLSLALYGLWPLRSLETPAQGHNASLWPWSLPVGLFLLAYSIRFRSWRCALAAGPFLSPYVLFHSWVGALVVLANRPKWLGVTVMLLWGLVAVIALT